MGDIFSRLSNVAAFYTTAPDGTPAGTHTAEFEYHSRSSQSSYNDSFFQTYTVEQRKETQIEKDPPTAYVGGARVDINIVCPNFDGLCP